jgi:hypothetical protein
MLAPARAPTLRRESLLDRVGIQQSVVSVARLKNISVNLDRPWPPRRLRCRKKNSVMTAHRGF